MTSGVTSSKNGRTGSKDRRMGDFIPGNVERTLDNQANTYHDVPIVRCRTVSDAAFQCLFKEELMPRLHAAEPNWLGTEEPVPQPPQPELPPKKPSEPELPSPDPRRAPFPGPGPTDPGLPPSVSY